MASLSISVYETSIPVAIGKLATKLHARKGTDLAIECDGMSDTMSDAIAQGLWKFVGNKVEFASLEARNQCCAVDAFRENQCATNETEPCALFDVAYALWGNEIGHSDFASGRFLALASGEVNILAEAALLIGTGKRRVFNVLHLVEAALPYLPSLTVNDLIAVSTAQYPKTKNDLAGGLLFDAIEKALLRESSVAWSLYRHVRANPSEVVANLYCSSLLALVKTDFRDEAIACALKDVSSENPLVARIAIWVVARVLRTDFDNLDLRDQCVQAIRRTTMHQDAEIRRGAIDALTHAAVSRTELIVDLLELAQSHDQYALANVAEFVFMNFDIVKLHSLFSDLIGELTYLSIENTRGTDSFDSSMRKLFKDEQHGALAQQSLMAWVLHNGNTTLREKGSIEHLDQTIRVISDNPKILEKIITEWLAAEQTQLVVAACGIISFLWVHGFRTPTFSSKVLDRLNPSELKCLARRMLGYVFHEEPLLSLTFSLLNAENASSRTFGLVHALLCEEVGRDFPQGTLSEIQQRIASADEESKKLLQSAYHQISSREKAIEDLPLLPELRPPVQLRRAISLNKARLMRRSMDEADKKSIFRQIATSISIKAGTGFFEVRNGEIGETHRMQRYSHQVSLPRRSVVDPVGYAIRGLHYRIANRDDE